MSWTTLYITGKPGFKDAVLGSLEDSKVSFLPGSTEGDADLLLFWIDEKSPLRDFKKAIGSKIVFKYRLQFFYTMNQRPENKTSKLTEREEALIRKMTAWEAGRFRHSA